MEPPLLARIVHALPRRVRLRSPALVNKHREAARIARRLAENPRHERVSVRPDTGSVLIEARTGTLDPVKLLAMLEQLLREERLVEAAAREWEQAIAGPTDFARALSSALTAINTDVRRALDGRADLGTLLPLVFAAGGLVEVGVTRRMPAPSWFNLLWWSLRTFMTFNLEAVEELSKGIAPADSQRQGRAKRSRRPPSPRKPRRSHG